MSKARLTAVASVVLAMCVFVPRAQAQVPRTWVSGVGDDINPCSRTAPCKTFAGAISRTASPGEIDTLDPGGFGAVTITKSITLDGTAGLAGLLASGTSGIVINAPGLAVTVRNLDINGLGTGLDGIHIIGAGDVRVENCKIYGFSHGIDDLRTSGHLEVTNTMVSNNSQTGILTLPGAAATLTVTLDRVQMDNNGNAGLAITNGTQAIVTRSSATANVHGFYADTNAVLNLNESVAFSNMTTGINSQTGATVMMFGSTVTNNATGLSVSGGSIVSFGFNRISGNAAGNGPPTGTAMLQ